MDNTISTRSSKKELLALMLAEKGLSPAQQQRLEKGHRGENLPLSFAQERLWFLDQLDPGNSVNNIPSAWHLHGHLDSAALEQSITTILQRHEALRTVFVDQQGKPAQVIVPTLDFALLSVDLTSYTGAEREDALQRQIKAEARYSFDLAHGPLIRAVLIRLTPEEHVFLLTMHHIVSDGWSIDIFTRELSLLYSQYVAQKVAEPLPTLPIQYADYAIWQRTWLQGAVVQKQLSYWKQQLTGAPPLLELPTDRPRPAVRTHQGAYLPFTLDAHLVHSIKELSRREGTTLFMTLLAAFQILLARYSGQDDIVVGTPVASRNHSEIENLIGFFLNNLALRSTISGGTSFHAVLEQVRRVTLDAFTHQNVPFEQVLQELGVERTSSHTPLFQVFFNMQNFDNNEMALPGLTIEKIPPHEVESKFDLTLYIEEQQKTIQLNLLYNTDLFNPGRMEQMLEQYQLLLEQIVQNPAEQIDHFSLVTPTARQYLPDVTRPLSAEWYGPVFAPLSLHAQDEPQREAIRDASGTWSYKQLNTRSNQVAHYLIEHGVRKGDTVALYGYRSAALVCALIGILKAGAAVCILDPAYPAERLLSYLDALSPRGWIRIVEAGTPANAVAEYVAAKLKHSTLEISADDRSADDTVLHNYAKDNPQITIGPDDLAIISFTSGSTGKPKGVLGRHGPLSHFQPWQQQTYNFNANDRYSMLSGLSHDPLQREIFTPLWFGATICIPTTEERGLSGKLADWLKREAISIAHLTPAMMQLLVPKAYTSASQDTIPSLRAIFITGDMVTTQDLSNIRNIAPDAICVNSYGSTETQRAVANYIVPAKRDVNDLLGGNEPGASTRATVPVGQGIQDVQILILTTGVSLAGIGEVGEIYVRSPHLSAGYLNDDELTRQRFIHNPFTNDLSDRLYKTGDLGRYLPDGIVEVLGRLDLQAKIRGFRVELGEIEVALKHHPAIQECLAVVREDTPGAKRLVSYIVLRDAEKITGKDLYRFLKQKLPDYMLPAAFVELETLPVTPNGKIDRKALPAPELVTEAQNGQVTDTLTPFEEMLASIWEQALDRASVNREDNFFELGGHSLLAIQVISRVRDAFQIELPLRCLFDAPTIAGMAEHIAATIAEATDLQAPTIASAPRNRDLPLSFAQQRLWFLDQLTPGDPAYNIHFGLHLQGQLDRSVLERSLSEIVKRHEALRTTFAADGSRQLIANPAFVALPYIDLRERLKDVDSEGKRTIIAQVASTEAKRSFDLAQGPLFRSMLVRTESEEHILLLTMHHIVSDGWSINVLMKELIALYSAFLQGEGDPLAALPIQYADYAIWQRTWLQGAVVQKQLSYWKQQLAGAPPLLELPTDRPRPAVQTHQGAYLPFTLDADLAHSIKELSRREGTTLFMTLLAAFQILLARYSGQDDIVVGTPVASRNHSEIENLIGFFVNTLIIRAQFPGTHTFREALSRVREQCLSAYVHQDLPLERLVEELQPQRMLGVNPLFQVMFVMQDTHLENIELPGLTVNAIDTERGTARFDVLLSCAETPTGLAGYFEYNTDLFEAATIERMKNYLFILLEALVAEPDRQVADVSLLPADERHRVLVEWNSTRTDWPATQSINDLFEKQTKETPQAVAVMYEEKQQTYEELDQRANQLARLLQARGVAAETRVGIYMERSLELPTAIFGVLKAGGVYVPFDPSYPEERIIYMLRDAAITLIIAQRTLAEKLAQLAPECQIICLDGEDTELDRQPVERVAAPIDAENLAYILYTSGSTGAPKGTMITHRGLMNYLYWCRQRYTVTEGTGAPVHSSLAFDLTVTSLFSPLLAGRTVHLLPSEKGIEALGNACCAQNAFSLIKITPAHMALLSQHLSKRQQVHGTKLFVIGGEQLFAEKLVFLRDLMPGTRFINEYGPTETVVGCCVYEVPQSPLEAGPVPIGRPIANTQLYVLDQHLQPVPIGLVGELYIAGAGLARGYLHRPALTAERFIPHPFSAQAGERLYKTGDLVRYRPDGILEFLGRNDHQVKLRGFRTELGEIENVLRQHPAVHDTVVTMREIRQGDERLVAYAVLKQDQAASAHELRQFMEQKLPLSMVPTHLILLDTFPLTTNGKVDYRQLPAPETGRQEVKTAYAPPHTAIERSIAACWQDVLQVEKVGLHDNFFDLGGHSLLLTQVYQKLEQSTQAEITLVDLFQYPTISTLAEHIGQKSGLKPSVQEEDTRTEQLVAGRNRTRQRLRQRLQENQ
jgi:amino acid adenylation domain-containing protein